VQAVAGGVGAYLGELLVEPAEQPADSIFLLLVKLFLSVTVFHNTYRRSLEEMVLVEGRFRWNRLDNLLREGAKSSELTAEQLWLLADFVVRTPPGLFPNPAHPFLVAIRGWAPRAVNSCLSRCGLSPILRFAAPALHVVCPLRPASQSPSSIAKAVAGSCLPPLLCPAFGVGQAVAGTVSCTRGPLRRSSWCESHETRIKSL